MSIPRKTFQIIAPASLEWLRATTRLPHFNGPGFRNQRCGEGLARYFADALDT